MRRSVSLIRPSSSASAPSRSLRCASSSSTWVTASSYSWPASGLTGPSCSRRRSQALHARLEGGALLVGQRLGGRLGLESEPPGQLHELALHVGGRVTRLLGRDLAVRDRLAGPPSRPCSSASSWAQARSAAAVWSPAAAPASSSAARASRRASTAARAASSARATRSAARVEVGVGLDSGPERDQRVRAFGALALGALGHPPLCPEVGDQARAANPVGSLVGALTPALEQPRARSASSLASAWSRAARRRVASASSRAASAPTTASAATPTASRARFSSAAAALRGRHELIAPAELLEQALAAARRRLGELACGGVEKAAGARDGHAAEGARDGVQRIHHPNVTEEPLGQPRRLLHGGHVRQEPRSARHRRLAGRAAMGS